MESLARLVFTLIIVFTLISFGSGFLISFSVSNIIFKYISVAASCGLTMIFLPFPTNIKIFFCICLCLAFGLAEYFFQN